MIRFCLKEIICQDFLWIIDLYNVQQKSLGRGSDHFIQFVLYRPLLDTLVFGREGRGLLIIIQFKSTLKIFYEIGKPLKPGFWHNFTHIHLGTYSKSNLLC